MKRNNLWNHLFHQREVEEYLKRSMKLNGLIKDAPNLLARIGKVTYNQNNASEPAHISGAKTLLEVLAIHKEAWNIGFQNRHLGPNMTFRCKDIGIMAADDVFLGDIFGLWTATIPEWEKYKTEGKRGGAWEIYNYLTPYEIILRWYKETLSTEISNLVEQFCDEKIELSAYGYIC